ncbi:MAG: N-acetyltransferase GCN5 [Stygiobacter sp.]|nr:MAG: N-acetyltransferase GCN5 [Stygiobacter sp.]KAF0217675.1 MAG: N-acetyltransferase [Ignavibacteria bacterium]
MIVCREFEDKYAERVSRLLNQLGYSVNSDELPNRIENIRENGKGTVFLALEDEKVLACIHTMVVSRLAEVTCGEVISLVVDESARGKGIGKFLLGESINWLKTRGQTKVRIRCNTIWEEAHKFYLHLGYTEKKSQKVFEKNI